MEKEEKLDEILNAKNEEVQSKISNIYKMTKFLLNKNIKDGKGKIATHEGGITKYSLVIDTDKYRFGFTYSNFKHSHLQITAAKKYYETNKEKSVSGGHITLNSYVFDVIEQTDKNLYVKKYTPGKNGPDYINEWEEALMELINGGPSIENSSSSIDWY